MDVNIFLSKYFVKINSETPIISNQMMVLKYL